MQFPRANGALAQIQELVRYYEANEAAFFAPSFNETQTREQLINPFFEALGWDVTNKGRSAEQYKDVMLEEALRTGGTTTAPDYSFRYGGVRKFFVEAKRVAVTIKDNPAWAFQLRRYAWSAKHPISILTNFREFAAYDCRVKPNESDKPSVARIAYYTYNEYVEKWSEIEAAFSKEAVRLGTFDKYAGTAKGKRGTVEVDDDFLALIERWRGDLAKHLALRNPALSMRDLNYAVQRIIDRIIFLRISEDRGIETAGRLQALTNGPRIYPRLVQLFQQADGKYNSGLFHFQKEKDRPEPPDELTPDLKLEDDVLSGIIADLYYPSPYVFNVIPADILGQVYGAVPR